eukprot:2631653-Rhodomonas_salina.3
MYPAGIPTRGTGYPQYPGTGYCRSERDRTKFVKIGRSSKKTVPGYPGIKQHWQWQGARKESNFGPGPKNARGGVQLKQEVRKWHLHFTTHHVFL